jgi:hypothetical protein
MQIAQIAAASTGWYWRGTETATGKTVVYPVAVWALTRGGDVVGLIGDVQAKTSEGSTSLAAPPAAGFERAAYIAESELHPARK